MPAHESETTLYAALELRALAEARPARPTLGLVFVIDTSGSMRDEALPNATRLQVVMQAMHRLVDSGAMRPADRVAILHFNDSVGTLLGYTSASETGSLHSAIEQLGHFSGGTLMGEGMRHALGLFGRGEVSSERMILLTDGQTTDEELVLEVTSQLAERHVNVIAVGIGADWNDALLTKVTDRTQGRPFCVVSDADAGHDPVGLAIKASDFESLLAAEFGRAALEVITNVSATMRTVRDVRLLRFTKVYPSLVEVAPGPGPLPMGNVGATEGAVFLLELRVAGRAPGRARVAQLTATYDVPGAGFRGEVGPLDIVLEFSADEARCAVINQEVFDYVGQRNALGLVAEAIEEMDRNPERARRAIDTARAIAGKVGNSALSEALTQVAGDLNSGKTISPQTRKTLIVGTKTKTVQMGAAELAGLTDEEIRRLSGT